MFLSEFATRDCARRPDRQTSWIVYASRSQTSSRHCEFRGGSYRILQLLCPNVTTQPNVWFQCLSGFLRSTGVLVSYRLLTPPDDLRAFHRLVTPDSRLTVTSIRRQVR